jgi:hypothetical protein
LLNVEWSHIVLSIGRPTNQHVVGNLFHPHALATNRVQHLQQKSSHQVLPRDARPTSFHVSLAHPRENLVYAFKRVIEPRANRTQRMILRHKIVVLQHRER